MTQFLPTKTTVMFGDELVAYGTQAATIQQCIGHVTSFSPRVSNGLFEHRGIGVGRNLDIMTYGPLDVDFSVDFEVGDFGFLKYLVGPIAGAGTTASKFTIIEADLIGITAASQILPFSVQAGSEAGTTDDVDTFTGCCARSATINFAQGAPIRGTLSVIAQSVTSAASGAVGYGSYKYIGNTNSPAFIGTRPWIFQQAKLYFDTNATPTTQIAGVVSGNITVDGDLKVFRSVGSRMIEQPQTGIRRYSFSFVTRMTDTIATQIRDYMYGQANSPHAGVTSAQPNEGALKNLRLNIQEGSSSGDRTSDIILDEIYIADMSKPVALGNEVVEVTFTGTASHASGTSGSGVFCTFYQVT